jgi:hypothetical protein
LSAALAKAVLEAGYSTRPLSEKLGYKPGMAAGFIAPPAHLDPLIAAVGFSYVTSAARWTEFRARPDAYDVIHVFAMRADEIEAGLGVLQSAIKRDGMIWISWPKKTSGIVCDVSESFVRAAALKLDLVDVKVAAIDAVWSGLKFVIRRDRR